MAREDELVIDEGSKIDNLVQIARECQIGRHCVINSQTEMAGSVVLEDGVVLASRSRRQGDHTRVGAGADMGGVGRDGVRAFSPRRRVQLLVRPPEKSVKE